MNESFLLAIAMIHVALDRLCSKKNYLIANRRIE
jgi:hypothetical protein